MTNMASKEKNGGVLKRRSVFLQAMRRRTFEAGYFTIVDIALAVDVPRSTAQDWINRLVQEGCIYLKEEQRGRTPARYASRSALPQTTCRRIITTVDDDLVEIFHECLSSGCAGFCEYHHQNAGGATVRVTRDGMLLRELARIGPAPQPDLTHAAVGLSSVEHDGNAVFQTIVSVCGGPAYSLSAMMGHAKGVDDVQISVSSDRIVTARVKTKALIALTVGIDDTDRKGCGGATFALSHALLNYLTESGDAIGISHQVAELYQDIDEKTAGNSCSFLELAVDPQNLATLTAKICRFVEEESVSDEWGVAVLSGIRVPDTLLDYACAARMRRVTLNEACAAAAACQVRLFGGRGRIGALAAASLKNQPQESLLNTTIPLRRP